MTSSETLRVARCAALCMSNLAAQSLHTRRVTYRPALQPGVATRGCGELVSAALEVVRMQMDAAELPGGGKQLAEQLDAIRQLQGLVGGQADRAGSPEQPASQQHGLQGVVCSAATSAMQANLLLASEVSSPGCIPSPAALVLAGFRKLLRAGTHAQPHCIDTLQSGSD